jgi:hypothetical protein
MMQKKSVRIAVIVVVALAVVGLGYLGRREAMKRNWIKINEYDIRSEGTLQVGDLAPDLELETADGNGAHKLSDFYRERPVVLAFGSYT